MSEPQNVPKIQRRLLAWYSANARDLPWRRTKDPYKIWVSEIMLQQTQVDTVIPFYNRWVRKFPTIEKLASARETEVMKSWAGLGYYRRARNLQACAKTLVGNSKGKARLPSDVEALMKLPGIGRYTAGAIASIAFQKPEPILDGNAKRVLSRIFAISEAVDQPAGEEKLWKIASALVIPMSSPRKRRSRALDSRLRGNDGKNRPGDFNQAMMELGATVCFPAEPDCPVCPLSKICRAHLSKTELSHPVKSRSEKITAVKSAALVMRNNGRVLIEKQARDARWGGLWMFPHWPDKKEMLHYIGETEKNLNKRMTVVHGFTRYRVSLEVFEFPVSSSRFTVKNENSKLEIRNSKLSTRWVPLSKLSQYPFPSPHKKIVEHLAEHG